MFPRSRLDLGPSGRFRRGIAIGPTRQRTRYRSCRPKVAAVAGLRETGPVATPTRAEIFGLVLLLPLSVPPAPPVWPAPILDGRPLGLRPELMLALPASALRACARSDQPRSRRGTLGTQTGTDIGLACTAAAPPPDPANSGPRGETLGTQTGTDVGLAKIHAPSPPVFPVPMPEVRSLVCTLGSGGGRLSEVPEAAPPAVVEPTSPPRAERLDRIGQS